MRIVLAIAFACIVATQAEAGFMDMWKSATSAITSTVTSWGKDVCYEELGCFSMSAPWFTPFRLFPAPKSPDHINVRLYCYSRDSPQRYNVSVWPTIDLNGFPFQAEKRTVIITHGFGNHGNMTWQDQMKDKYLALVDANVCINDWGIGASDANYMQVASNTRIVGAVVSRFVRYLQSEYGLEASNMHLIGHSLGSHISSYIANQVEGRVARITGLDVAQPGFEGYEKEVGLDADDADFVDAIHSNGLPFLPNGGFGYRRNLGDVDIYLNGGRFQPGCESPDFSKVKSFMDLATVSVESLVNWIGCSHGRAFEAFIATLSPDCNLWARACTLDKNFIARNSTVATCTATTCIPVGLDTVNYPGRGTFIAYTTSKDSFCDTEEVCKKFDSEMAASMSS